jgi:hypothetical protein
MFTSPPTVRLTSMDHPYIEGALFLASAHAIDSIFDPITGGAVGSQPRGIAH